MNELEKIKISMQEDKPLIWLFTGDSITHGALHTYGWRSFPEHFSERIRFELNRRHDYVINTGISGDNADNMLARFDWRVSHFSPDVVFVMIGTNDCLAGQAGLEKYEANLLQLVKLIRKNNSIPIFNTPNPIIQELGGGKERACLPAYTHVMKEMAIRENIILVDNWKSWEMQKENKDSLSEWLADSIHPNLYGHIAIAKEIFRTLGIYDDAKSTVCRFFTP